MGYITSQKKKNTLNSPGNGHTRSGIGFKSKFNVRLLESNTQLRKHWDIKQKDCTKNTRKKHIQKTARPGPGPRYAKMAVPYPQLWHSQGGVGPAEAAEVWEAPPPVSVSVFHGPVEIKWLTFLEHLLCAKHINGSFSDISSLNSYNSPMIYIIIIISILQRRKEAHWGEATSLGSLSS